MVFSESDSEGDKTNEEVLNEIPLQNSNIQEPDSSNINNDLAIVNKNNHDHLDQIIPNNDDALMPTEQKINRTEAREKNLKRFSKRLENLKNLHETWVSRPICFEA